MRIKLHTEGILGMDTTLVTVLEMEMELDMDPAIAIFITNALGGDVETVSHMETNMETEPGTQLDMGPNIKQP
jgi:hypothetical protein